MGVNNRQRRKAKKEQRRQKQSAGARHFHAGTPGGDRFHGGRVDEVEVARHTVLLAAAAFGSEEEAEYQALLGALGALDQRTGRGVVHAAVAWWIERGLDRAWGVGWQPADVVRYLRRQLGPGQAGAVSAAVATSAAARPEAGIDDRWAEQVAAIRAGHPAVPDLGPGAPSFPFGIEAASVLLDLPSIPRLSASRSSRLSGRPGSAAMLEKVRALLAKAESTTFPDEAEALTAKAQELMARHAIDTAMLDIGGSGGGGDAVVGWRIGVDDPYASAKSLLLARIADANRSSAVWCKELGSSTVFGTRSDLEMVELLYMSLLVQGTDAMLRAGRSVDRYGRSRTTSFRKSFLDAYALRIGERLAAATEDAVVEGAARHGDALLPVLAGRAEAVDDAVRDAFPETFSRGTRITNHAGWVAGRAAADLASLGVGGQLEQG